MGLKTEALVFESCRLWPEARDSGQLFLRPLLDSNPLETEPFHKAGKGIPYEPCGSQCYYC